jgi:capsular polysaccharide biosynthesis protein
MELRRYLAVLKKRWPLVAATVVLALVLAVLATPRTARYTASSTIVVGPRQYSTTQGNSSTISGDQAVGVIILLQTYAELIPTAPVAMDALAQTGVPRSAGTVVAETRASAIPSTQLLTITITDPVPTVAQALATGMANAFVNKVNSFKPDQAATVGTLPEIPVYVFQPALLPTVPQSTGLRSNLILAGIFGLLAALAAVALLEYLDVTIKTTEDAEARLGLPVLGAIPLLDQLGQGPSLAAASFGSSSRSSRSSRLSVVEPTVMEPRSG